MYGLSMIVVFMTLLMETSDVWLYVISVEIWMKET